jgi:hypothetical protein
MLRDVSNVNTFEMSQGQINDLESRHPEVQTVLDSFVYMSQSRAEQGIAFADEVYGTVLISVDASDNLHMIANAPGSETVYNQTGTGTYNPPPNVDTSACTYSLENFWGCLKTYGNVILIGLGIYFFMGKKK